MKRFESKVNVQSEDFKNNYAAMSKLAKDLDEKMRFWQFQGTDRRVNRHIKKGKMLARERLELLLDQDSPFLEIAPLAGFGQDDVSQGNPTLIGVGIVCGVECAILIDVHTVGFGSWNEITNRKRARIFEISLENRLPCLQMLESGGIDLDKAFQFHENPNKFYSMAQRSKQRVPCITVVFGSCIAGGAYLAGMSDYVISIKNQATLALAGSKLTKVATGEDSTEEELGSAVMHSRVSGVSDFLVNNEHEGIAKAREVVKSIAHTQEKKSDLVSNAMNPDLDDYILEPYYDPDEMLGIASVDNKFGYDCREIMCRIVDDSKLSEFKPDYGGTVVTCFAHIMGTPVGLVGNNGVVFHQSAQKATHFINLCNQKAIPIIYLHNVTGFMVGKKYESEGMIKWGSQMVNAVSNSNVPQISIIIGGSYGAANFAMCGYGFKPNFIFSWPNAQCAVMGGEQLAGVMELLARESAQRKGITVDEPKVQGQTNRLINTMNKQANAYYTSSRGVDDGIIDPRDTRMVVSMCLSAFCNRDIEPSFITGISRL